MKLKLATASVMVRPGTIAIQGALVRYCCAPLSMLPQLGRGGLDAETEKADIGLGKNGSGHG